ncbi:MAG: ferritin family protein [candidate division KSB1 bacterium]|nr:ferritin family protein [candidate division KSB1 bacterium]
MGQNDLADILQFAISKEIQAVQMYSLMAKKAEFPHVRQLFEELAAEERNHRKMLQELDVSEIEGQDLTQFPEIRLTDYTVAQEFRPDMGLQDALLLAIQREEKSYALYQKLQSGVVGKVRALFTFLAGEEVKHRERLQKLYEEGILSEF